VLVIAADLRRSAREGKMASVIPFVEFWSKACQADKQREMDYAITASNLIFHFKPFKTH
jgi:hypothetical protein